MDYTVNSETFNVFWSLLLANISLTSVRGLQSLCGLSYASPRRSFYCMVVDFCSLVNDTLIGAQGLYVNLFILAIHTLSRRKTAGRSPLLLASWAMFILGTTRIIIRLIANGISVCLLQQVVQQRNSASKLLQTYNSLQATEDILFGINKLDHVLFCSRLN